MTETSIEIRPAVAAAAHEPSGRRPGALANITLLAALVVLAGIVLVPVLATALNGFKELGELQSRPFCLPRVWVWQQLLGHPDRLPLLAGARQFAADRDADRRS